jgi:hypothetical protein
MPPAAFIDTVQVGMAAQPLLQPVKAEPAAGVAVKVTSVPLVNDAEQVAPQVDAGGRAGDCPDAVAGLRHREREGLQARTSP